MAESARHSWMQIPRYGRLGRACTERAEEAGQRRPSLSALEGKLPTYRKRPVFRTFWEGRSEFAAPGEDERAQEFHIRKLLLGTDESHQDQNVGRQRIRVATDATRRVIYPRDPPVRRPRLSPSRPAPASPLRAKNRRCPR